VRSLTVLLLSLPLSALAGAPERNADNHCFSTVERVAFHCATDSGKWISVCADAQSAAPTHIVYRYGKKGAIELEKPEIDDKNLSRWAYVEEPMISGEQRTLTFTNEGYSYQVFVTEAGRDTQAGVVVSKGDKALATLTCANQTFTDSLTSVKPAITD